MTFKVRMTFILEYPLTWGRWREIDGFEKQNACRDNPFSVLQNMAGLKKCACLSTWTDYMISFEICTGSFYPLGLISESSAVIKENKIMFVLSSGAQSSINFSFPPPLHSPFQKKMYRWRSSPYSSPKISDLQQLL